MQQITPAEETSSKRRIAQGLSDPYYMGLPTARHGWMYRRAFWTWQCSDNNNWSCNHQTFAALSDAQPEKAFGACAQMAAHRSWWLTDPYELPQQQGTAGQDGPNPDFPLYALRFPFPAMLQPQQLLSCTAVISILGGIQNCSRPIESLTFTNDYNKTSKEMMDDLGCIYDSSVKAATALVQVIVPPKIFNTTTEHPQNDVYINDTSLNLNWSHVDMGSWAVDGSKWIESTLIDNNNKTSMNIDNARKVAVQNLCLIGDSHFERNYNDVIPKVAMETLGIPKGNLQYYSNFVFPQTSEIRTPIETRIEQCAKWLQSQPGRGALVMSLGSHFPAASPEEFANVTRKLIDLVQDLDIPCSVLSSAVDICHENIPAQFYSAQRLIRNSWRNMAKAEAVHAAVNDARLQQNVNIHYSDVFTPSSVLHFGHCEGGDPIHWHRGTFYHEMVRILFDTVRLNC